MLIWFIVALLLLLFTGYAAVLGARFLRYKKVSKGILSARVVHDIVPPDAKSHVLVVGDSTMYSAGVSDPAYTIGGLFAGLYPHASVETRAANGALCRDVPAQLDAGAYQHYDIIMIGIGGNDVVRLTPHHRLRQELRRLLEVASQKADKVIICSSVNVGNVGFFPFPLNHLYDARSRGFAEVCQQVADSIETVQFVNFYRPLHDDHYDKHSRGTFVAADGFHANAYANEYFFNLIVKEAGLKPQLTRDDHS